jgi:large subunit ribosomal protein L21
MITDGGKVNVGAPLVADAMVVAEVLEHGKAKKVISFKFKAKTRYRRKRGHRQGYTKLQVREILTDGAQPSAKTEATPVAAVESESPEAAIEAAPVAAVESESPEATIETTPVRRRRRAVTEEAPTEETPEEETAAEGSPAEESTQE